MSALVGQKRWDSPDVIAELDLLRTIATWNGYWENMKVAEQRAYGQRSYFYCKEHDIDPDTLVDEDVPGDVGETEGVELGSPTGDHY